MVGRVTIEPACLRDASYVVANMRPADAEEVWCQVPEGTTGYELAHMLLFSGDAFIAKLDGVPAAFLGTQPLNVACMVAWAVGTKRMPRVLPALTRFAIQEHIPKRIAQGFVTMEARSLVGHEDAHRWLRSTGAVVQGEPFVYGRNREKFLLFRWSADALDAAARRYKVTT